MRAVVLPADNQDRDGAQDVGHGAAPVGPRLEQIWADHADAGDLVAWVRAEYGWRLVIVGKAPGQAGFVVHRRRCVVERTFAGLGRNRRLRKDCEAYPETSEAWIYIASGRLMLHRLAA